MLTQVMKMKLRIKRTKTPQTVYRSLYIRQSLVDEIERIAVQNDVSWNYTAVSLLERAVQQEQNASE